MGRLRVVSPQLLFGEQSILDVVAIESAALFIEVMSKLGYLIE